MKKFAASLLACATLACSAQSANNTNVQDGTGNGGDSSSGGSDTANGSGGSDTANGSGGSSGDDALPTLEECPSGSIDRYQQWLASGEGPTIPATGSLLIEEAGQQVAHAEFTQNGQWHVLAIWLGNEFGASIDLSSSNGFTLRYSATADFYIQLRDATNWSGGAKWHMLIPGTNGTVVSSFFPFDGTQWVEKLGTPPLSFEQTLTDASGFVPVGNTSNVINFYRLVIDGYTPVCK